MSKCQSVGGADLTRLLSIIHIHTASSTHLSFQSSVWPTLNHYSLHPFMIHDSLLVQAVIRHHVDTVRYRPLTLTLTISTSNSQLVQAVIRRHVDTIR